MATPDLVKCAAYVGQHYFYFKFHLVRAVDGARPLSRPLRLLFCLSVSEVKMSASKNFIMTSSPTIVSNYLSRCKHQDIAKSLWMRPLHQGIAVITVVSLLVYANTLFGGLVFDDQEAIVNNRDVR